MQFGLFVTHQLPRPWSADAEQRLFHEALDQLELADALGFHYGWVTEQHFLEEYSHSSAPEVFLGAASQRTKRMRIGHAVVLLPPAYNHPARVAERIATLDLLSNGRLDVGVGDSKSRLELEGFSVDAPNRRAMTLEALQQIVQMLGPDAFPGHTGRWFSMPARNVVPKPVQRPHPPLWMACSDDATVHAAAQLGLGALVHGFFDPDEAAHVVADYYDTFKRECVPIGAAVNPNVAMLNPFYCHAEDEVALQQGRAASGFMTFAVRHYYSFGRHRPGLTNVWERYEAVRNELGEVPLRGSHAIGSPERIAQRLGQYEAAGVDQTILAHQAGGMAHAEICESLRLFAQAVMPAFRSREDERQQRKRRELEPFVRAAMERRRELVREADHDVPAVDAYGRDRPPPDLSALPAIQRQSAIEMDRLRDAALRVERRPD